MINVTSKPSGIVKMRVVLYNGGELTIRREVRDTGRPAFVVRVVDFNDRLVYAVAYATLADAADDARDWRPLS